MDQAEYKELCCLTESQPERIDETTVFWALKLAQHSGDLVDFAKKAAFYGKKIDIAEVIKARDLADEAMHNLLNGLLSNGDSLEDVCPFRCNLSLIHGALGHASESGELAAAVTSAAEQGLTPEIAENIQEELGDHDWYTSVMLDPLKTTRPELWIRNIAKLKKRFPEGHFTAQRAIGRNTDAEMDAFRKAECTKSE